MSVWKDLQYHAETNQMTGFFKVGAFVELFSEQTIVYIIYYMRIESFLFITRHSKYIKEY